VNQTEFIERYALTHTGSRISVVDGVPLLVTPHAPVGCEKHDGAAVALPPGQHCEHATPDYIDPDFIETGYGWGICCYCSATVEWSAADLL
jgi:hypothetical protein